LIVPFIFVNIVHIIGLAVGLGLELELVLVLDLRLVLRYRISLLWLHFILC